MEHTRSIVIRNIVGDFILHAIKSFQTTSTESASLVGSFAFKMSFIIFMTRFK